MYRFLLPSFLMVGALLVLFAGAFGNLTSLPDLTSELVAHITNTAPKRATPPAADITDSPPASPAASTVPADQPAQASALDTLKQQAAELQTQITQRSRELSSLQGNEDQVHHELDALHQQRQTEAAAVAQLQAQQRQLAAVSANQPAPEALEKQVTTLEGQITQRSQELAALRSSEDQAQHDIDKLHQERQTEEAAVAQLQTQQRQMAAVQAKQPSPEALQQQVTALQAQITQRSQELAALRSSEDQAQHDIDKLHQERQTEETAVAQLQAQQRQMAAVQAKQPSPEALQQQVTALQAQITQRSQELAALRSSEDQAQHDLDTLRQQHQTEEATVTRLQTQQRQIAAAAQPDTAAPPQSASEPSDNTAVQTALARLRARQQPPPQRVATQPVLLPSPRDDLVTARQLLASGRPSDARQLLVKAQAESALRPVTPDQPVATGGNMTATRIGDAIRFLDAGNMGYALQSINLAMDDTSGGTRVWPSYPREPPPGYGYPARPGY